MPGVSPMGLTAGPVTAMPSVAGEIGQAAASIPQQQQEYQLRQAELQAQQMNTSSQRLALLTKLVSSNAGLATNPQVIAAAKSAFGGFGIPAPMTNKNGVASLDTDALYSFGPASDFVSQNLQMLLSFQPGQRAELIKAFTGQDVPEGMAENLSKLPQRMITTPTELGGLYNRANQAIENLRFPGATVDGALAIISPINTVLEQNGMPGVDITDLLGDQPLQSLRNIAEAQGLKGKAAEEWANANYKTIETRLAPAELKVKQENAAANTTKAGAAVVSANASASRAATEAKRAPAEIARDYADADKAVADAKKTIQEVQTGGATLKDLESNANNAQAIVARLESDLNDPTQGLKQQEATLDPNSPTYAADRKQLNDTIYATEERIKSARNAAAISQRAFQQAQAKLHAGSAAGQPHKGHAPAGAATKTLPDGTVIYKGPDGKAYRDDNGELYSPP